MPTLQPASSNTVAAERTCVPVVDTSSTRATSAPAGACPSSCDIVPYAFGSLRTTAIGRPVSSPTAATSKVAAPSGAARCVIASGRSSATAFAVSLNRCGSVRNRNLSK